MRRECLDWVIPLSEKHLRRILREWVVHYNRGRPHASLGPGIPEPATTRRLSPKHPRQELPPDCRIRIKEVLGGLHHEYRLDKSPREIDALSADHNVEG
jgi:putative transposase